MPVTGQVQFDGYSDAGLFVAVDLVNEIALPGRRGADALGAIGSILEFDPATRTRLRRRHVDGFVALAAAMHGLVGLLAAGEIDPVADRLNGLLAEHPAHPHLAKENGRWRLHNHPASVDLVSMYSSICAENLARLISSGNAHRLGVCADRRCRRAYLDQSKNATRRYCSTTCQNRAKAAAFRARRRRAVTGGATAPASG